MPILIRLKLSIRVTLLRHKEIYTLLCHKERYKEIIAIYSFFCYFVCSLPYFPKGHSRHGNCMIHLKRYEEALKSFCKAHTCASSDKERNATASEVISSAMDVEGW